MILSLAKPEKPMQLCLMLLESHDYQTRCNLMVLMMERKDPTRIYEVTNPGSPQLRGLISYAPGETSYIHNAALTNDENYLLTTEEVVNRSVKIFNIRNFSNMPIVAQYLSGALQSGIAHNDYVKGYTANVSHYEQGFRVLNISNSAAPKEIVYYKPQYPTMALGVVLFGCDAWPFHSSFGRLGCGYPSIDPDA